MLTRWNGPCPARRPNTRSSSCQSRKTGINSTATKAPEINKKAPTSVGAFLRATVAVAGAAFGRHRPPFARTARMFALNPFPCTVAPRRTANDDPAANGHGSDARHPCSDINRVAGAGSVLIHRTFAKEFRTKWLFPSCSGPRRWVSPPHPRMRA